MYSGARSSHTEDKLWHDTFHAASLHYKGTILGKSSHATRALRTCEAPVVEHQEMLFFRLCLKAEQGLLLLC